ncbi:hypothetical protein [Nitrospira sp. Kam-Ns4a]
MRTWLLLGALVLCPLMALPAAAEDKGLEERIKQLEEALKKLEEREKMEREQVRPAEPVEQPGVGPLPEVGKDLRTEKQAPLSFSTTGSGRMVYAKPFVSAPKAIVGGYMDFFYTNQRKAPLDNGAGSSNPGIGRTSSSFDQQRFVPFIYADVTDHVKVASELEIEHGIRETSGDGRELEFGLEFATIDYLVREEVNLRGGILLLPIGKFNLLHDSPLNDVGPRPLVDQFVIPTTVAETGAGFYGTFYPTRLSKVDYELYITTGSNGYQKDGTPTINEKSGLRGTRLRKSFASDGLDNNNGKAVVGRVAVSPRLGMEIGGSGYFGTYDPNSKRELSIWALDWTFQRGPFELIGESAWAYAKDADKCLPVVATNVATNCVNGLYIDPDTGRPTPRRSQGFYIQGNYHFLPEFLTRLAPAHFHAGSTFTSFIRYDRVNTNLDVSAGGFGDLEKLTIGFNFRPVEDTVYRFAYEFNMRGFNPIDNRTVTGANALVLSAATYF